MMTQEDWLEEYPKIAPPGSIEIMWRTAMQLLSGCVGEKSFQLITARVKGFNSIINALLKFLDAGSKVDSMEDPFEYD